MYYFIVAYYTTDTSRRVWKVRIVFRKVEPTDFLETILFFSPLIFFLSLSLNKNSIILGRIIKNVETKQNNLHHTMLPHPSSTITNVA